MRWSFAKYEGCGNDFILFDNRSGAFPLSQLLIQHLCQRQKGIGADGLLLLENSTQAHGRMRVFNSDGSEAEMCGNGLRCFVKWLAHLGVHTPIYHIEVMHHILTAKHVDKAVCIEIMNPPYIQWDIPLRFEKQFLRVHFLNTGVPHVVLLMDSIENIDLNKLGVYIRNYSLWLPNGTNVTIAQKIDQQRLRSRTYERGIEKETLACGTGVAAAALVAARQYQLASPLMIETHSGEELRVEFSYNQQRFTDITLTGPVKWVFSGEIDLICPLID